MIFYIIASIVVSFIVGFVSHLIFAKKTIADLQNSIESAIRSTWHEAFDAGWKGASTDVTTVKTSYEKIFGTRK